MLVKFVMALITLRKSRGYICFNQASPKGVSKANLYNPASYPRGTELSKYGIARNRTANRKAMTTHQDDIFKFPFEVDDKFAPQRPIKIPKTAKFSFLS